MSAVPCNRGRESADRMSLAREQSLAGQVLLGVFPRGCDEPEAYLWPGEIAEAQFGLEVAVTGLRDALRRGDTDASRRWLRVAANDLQRLEQLVPPCRGGCRQGVLRSGIQQVAHRLRVDERPCPVCAPRAGGSRG